MVGRSFPEESSSLDWTEPSSPSTQKRADVQFNVFYNTLMQTQFHPNFSFVLAGTVCVAAVVADALHACVFARSTPALRLCMIARCELHALQSWLHLQQYLVHCPQCVDSKEKSAREETKRLGHFFFPPACCALVHQPEREKLNRDWNVVA